MATLAPKLLRAKQTQENWAKIRAAAEVSRSFLALWTTPARYRLLDKSEAPELHGMLEALNHLKIIAGSRNRQSDYSEFKNYYQKERIDEHLFR